MQRVIREREVNSSVNIVCELKNKHVRAFLPSVRVYMCEHIVECQYYN